MRELLLWAGLLCSVSMNVILWLALRSAERRGDALFAALRGERRNRIELEPRRIGMPRGSDGRP